MNKDTQARGENVAVETAVKQPVNVGTGNEKETRLPWHRPAITRIMIKRTMNSSGPNNDTSARFA